MTVVRTKLVDGGRVIVPAAMRKAMGVKSGDTLVLEVLTTDRRLAEADVGVVIERLR
jgi:AbrB family looped-hinge helix DNA binding protein